MLIFIAFRFNSWGFGIGAIIAVFHDVLITLGIFSIMQWEINLTVIAALLTLVGYSMNDTIVIFDRIRENIKILRREPLESLMNKSINQTLTRTVMTSGLTFLTVIALLPIWLTSLVNVPFRFGGTSLLIVVGVALDTMAQVNQHLLLRKYDGFMKKGRVRFRGRAAGGAY